MTLLPQLQQQLVSAVADEPVRRSRRLAAIAASTLLIIATAISASAWLAGTADDERSTRLPSVPDETLAKAVSYADVVPDESERSPSLDESAATRLAHDLLDVLPYPPGRQDDELLALTARLVRARDMSQISAARDLRTMGEYRAACTWQQFWVAAHQANDRAAQRAATAVLAIVPRWPLTSDAAQRVADAARRGDARVIERQVQLNCGSVGDQPLRKPGERADPNPPG